MAKVLSRDWGFWYTVTTNLRGIREYVKEMSVLSTQETSDLSSKVEELLSVADLVPKSLRWKLRAITGPRRKWYNPVETEETVGGFGIWRLREESKSKQIDEKPRSLFPQQLGLVCQSLIIFP